MASQPARHTRTPRLPGEIEISSWLADAGLDSSTPALAPALAQLCGGGLEALRVKAQLVSDDEMLGVLSPLGIRGMWVNASAP